MEAYFNGVKLTNNKEGNNFIYITDNNSVSNKIANRLAELNTVNKTVLLDENTANKIEELTRENETLKFDKKIYEINSITQAAHIAELKTVNELLQNMIVNLRTSGGEE